MSNYCEIETESFGQLFAKCGTKEVAGRNSNTSSSAGDDYILVSSYSFDAFSSKHSASLETAGFSIQLTVPLLPPVVASVLNILNSKNVLKKLTLVMNDGVGTLRNVSIGKYIAKEGILLSATIVESSHKDIPPCICLIMDFEEVSFDNLITNTTGTLKTSGSGY